MFVCICNKVTDTDIEAELESGNASSFEDIQRNLGVGTQCGKCTSCAKRIVRQHQASRLFHPQEAGPLPTNA